MPDRWQDCADLFASFIMGRMPDRKNSLAYWMDERFEIPGTGIRFGLDAILGLVPGFGEWATSLVQAYLVLSLLSRHEIPTSVAARMVANVAIDGLVGAIPLFGDVFDVFFKANTRNVRLAREVERELLVRGRVSAWRHRAFLLGVGLVLASVLVGTGYLAYRVVLALAGLLGISA